MQPTIGSFRWLDSAEFAIGLPDRLEHDLWARDFIKTFPPNLGRAVHKEFRARRSAPIAETVGRRARDFDGDRAGRAADWLRDIKERFPMQALSLGASESDIRGFAAESARKGQELVRWHAPLTRLRRFVASRGVDLPRARTEEGIRARLTCEQWWRRNLRRSTARKVEALSIELRTVHRRSALYCSEDALTRYTEQRRRNNALLESIVAINELGDQFTLQELADKSVSNPKIRRAELMTRIAGFEYIAQQCGLAGEFITITAPSKFHAHHSHDGSRNDKWEGAMPRDTQSYLLKVWSRASAALVRAGIYIFGFRVAEPHHDETPHFHGLFFMKPEHVTLFRKIVARYAVREDRDELGLHYALTRSEAIDRARTLKAAGAMRGTLPAIADTVGVESAFWKQPPRGVWQKIVARAKFKAIDWSRGTAAGYIAKYIAKNIDGERADGDSIGPDFESDGEQADARSSAPRVASWASTWGIRQFQQVGGPPVTVWRDLRRLNAKDAGEDSALMRAAVAADAGNWARFVEVMGGWEARRKDMPIKLARDSAEATKPNRYGEDAQPPVIGVVDATTGQLEVTRLHEWVLKPARDAGPWTRVNNSTNSKSCQAAPLERAAEPLHNDSAEASIHDDLPAVPNVDQFIAWAHEWAAPPGVVAELADAHASAARHAEISRSIKLARELIARIEPRAVESRPPTPARRTRRDRYAKAATISAQLQWQIGWLLKWNAQPTPLLLWPAAGPRVEAVCG
jgi:hypothetical protein